MKHLALVLVGVLLGWGCALLGGVSEAHAGEWAQRSCSYNGEYIAPEGWEAKAYYGYSELPHAYCEKIAEGSEGGLTVYAAPISGDQDFAGQGWIYKPPAGSSIAGGKVEARLRTRNGSSSVVSIVAERAVSKLCEYPSCEHYEGEVSIPAGASEVYVRASCVAPTEPPYVCHPPDESKWEDEGDYFFSAEADISSAEIILATKATPKGSGFTGSLTGETVSGPGTLSFTATDPGPGVYQVRVKVDGNQVWAETPNENGGKCVSAGTTAGVRVFDAFQPCPTETAVHAEVHTAILADGTHTVTVEVEDAAGDVATVYSGTLTTVNHATTTVLAPVERGPCNGTCDEAAQLTANDRALLKPITRHYRQSALTLSGVLHEPSGAYVPGAQLELLQQASYTGAPMVPIATTTTSPTGRWTFNVPRGPSRLLRVAWRSHVLDTAYAAQLEYHEEVYADIGLKAPRDVPVGTLFGFRGQLAGGYIPPERNYLEIKIFYDGKWRTIETVRTNRDGTFSYPYAFAQGTAGHSYRFLATIHYSSPYPFLANKSDEVRVWVR
jgi:hypothetical protein